VLVVLLKEQEELIPLLRSREPFPLNQVGIPSTSGDSCEESNCPVGRQLDALTGLLGGAKGAGAGAGGIPDIGESIQANSPLHLLN
jgi:hypothetical protein